MIDLDKLEAITKAAQERSPGPWKRVIAGGEPFNENDADTRFDFIKDSTPRPDWCDAGERWEGNTVLETDGGYYEPKEATGTHIATFSPDVAIALIARIRELEAALLRACHAGENLEYAYEDAHRHALQREIEKAGRLVGRKPGDSAP